MLKPGINRQRFTWAAHRPKAYLRSYHFDASVLRLLLFIFNVCCLKGLLLFKIKLASAISFASFGSVDLVGVLYRAIQLVERVAEELLSTGSHLVPKLKRAPTTIFIFLVYQVTLDHSVIALLCQNHVNMASVDHCMGLKVNNGVDACTRPARFFSLQRAAALIGGGTLAAFVLRLLRRRFGGNPVCRLLYLGDGLLLLDSLSSFFLHKVHYHVLSACDCIGGFR